MSSFLLISVKRLERESLRVNRPPSVEAEDRGEGEERFITVHCTSVLLKNTSRSLFYLVSKNIK